MRGKAPMRLLVFTLLAMGLAPLRAEVIDRVLAIVGAEIVTLSDVHVALALRLVDATGSADPIGAALSHLIDRRLVAGEVDRYAPPEPDEGAVDDRTAELAGRLPAGAATGAGPASLALDQSRLRAMARDELRIEAYLDRRFAVVAPTDDEVERYYGDRPEAFTRDGVRRPLDDVREEARRLLAAEHRARLVEEWMAGLRRRADIHVLHQPERPEAPR